MATLYDIATGFAGSALLAVFAFFIGMIVSVRWIRRRLRRWLEGRSKGWLRRIYVNALIAAIQGRAVNASHRHTANLMLIFPCLILLLTFVGSFLLTYLSDQSLTEVSGAQAFLYRLDELNAPESDSDPLSQRETDELKRKMEALVQHSKESMRRAADISQWLRILYMIAWLWMFGGWASHPMRLIRIEFECEYRRFIDHIRALASKAELASLITLESAVNDEKSAKEYCKHVKAIAERHDVARLARPFQLWESRSPREEANDPDNQ